VQVQCAPPTLPKAREERDASAVRATNAPKMPEVSSLPTDRVGATKRAVEHKGRKGRAVRSTAEGLAESLQDRVAGASRAACQQSPR
jgi:hypothetical protein